MALRLELNDIQADVTSVNVRTEKHGKEGKEIGTDVDFKAEVKAELMNQFSLGDPFSFENAFFDEEGRVLNVGISEMKIDRTFEEHMVKIVADDLFEQELSILATVKIKYIKPVNGRKFEIKLQAQVHPDAEQIPNLAQLLISGCTFTITPTSRVGSDEDKEGEQLWIEDGEAAA